MNFFIHRTNNKSIAHVTYDKKKILCYVGKNGIGEKKREGDLITPKGWYKMEKIFYREDKVSNFRSSLPTFRIKKNCAWCVPGSQQCGKARTWQNRVLDKNKRMKFQFKRAL